MRKPIGDTPFLSGESLIEMWVQSRVACNIMSTSRRNSKEKDPITNTDMQNLHSDEAQHIAQLIFGLGRMEAYYVSFKEKRSITVEAQFEVQSFKDDFRNIYNQINIWNWGQFTIPIGPCFPELVWEFYASYRM
ncbi:hypothetical protein HAX54_029527 [Datura stramonium]|uniref:Uncharacterized protein n=1 Tax=Datura stramonium TaxID=4076 RepID=A0ABS8V912_DATST|nr:hypothetical protein [Datura stramonium]